MRVFKESQRFTQTWVIALLLISAIVPIAIVLGTYYKDPNAFTITELVVVILIVSFSAGMIFFFKLITKIDELGIHYQFFPFHFKMRLIRWNTINKAFVRNYDAINEYGGWGLKGGALWKKSKGTAINVSGNIGIQLELQNGKKLLIGTQKEVEAKAIINHYMSDNNRS